MEAIQGTKPTFSVLSKETLAYEHKEDPLINLPTLGLVDNLVKPG